MYSGKPVCKPNHIYFNTNRTKNKTIFNEYYK